MKTSTQASLAVSADGNRWTLVNAAPDCRTQLNATGNLHPVGGTRGSPIEAVVLTGAEIDQIAGLLALRESQPFMLFGTDETLRCVDDNPIFAALRPECVTRRTVPLDQPFALPGGVQAKFFAVPGKVPLYLEHASPGVHGEGINVGVEFNAGGASVAYVPGAAAVTRALKERLARAAILLFDGTLFSDDEMIRTGTGTKTGRRMGHLPIDGAEGSLAVLDGLGARRIYIHINNTNPIRIRDSEARRKVEAAGWEVAEDGLEIVL